MTHQLLTAEEPCRPVAPRSRFWHILALACTDRSRQLPLEPTGPSASVSFQFPGEDPGPPYYSVIERQFTPHTADWAAIPFVRDPQCIASGFNLLDQIDVPQSFWCPLYVAGHVTYRNGPPPIDLAPIHAEFHDAAPVPVWFVVVARARSRHRRRRVDASRAERAAVAANRIGLVLLLQPASGSRAPAGDGQWQDRDRCPGRSPGRNVVLFQVREMGVDQVSVLRHISIEFK